MKWSKVLEQIHYLDRTIKDCVHLIPEGIESRNIPQADRCGLYAGEVNRLTLIGEKREADRSADQRARNVLVDAEVDRLRAENARFEQAKVDAFEAWDNKLKAARAPIEEKWTAV